MPRRPSALRAPLALLLATLAIACHGAEDPAGAGAGGGKADDLEGCAGAEVDVHGICRNDDGTFAPTACCIEEDACASATVDGTACRRTDNGQFAPWSCCEALCAGAALDAHGFCRNADGTFAFEACCADQCVTGELGPSVLRAPPGSCAGHCGTPAPEGCFCDDLCAETGDCCADKVEVCGGPGAPPDFDGLSCAGRCGDGAPSGCFCDDLCAANGDCCADKAQECGGEALPAPDCDDAGCEGAFVDGDGVCRTADGRFAKSSCCAAPTACAGAAIAGDGVCRTADGAAAPETCCGAVCDDPFLDRDGLCRNRDGRFADWACCADLCMELDRPSERGDRAATTPSCNGVDGPM